MSSTRQQNDEHPMSQFAQSRVRAERERNDQRDKATRTVARHCHNPQEYAGLLSMLGLDGDEPAGDHLDRP
jgi:hypothetical protein